MTENEVLEYLKSSKRKNDMLGILPGSDIGNTIIKALEELKQYRTIGTVEECQKAMTVRREVQEIVDQQLIAGEDSYEEIYACFWEIVKVVQANKSSSGELLDRRANDGKID